MLPWQFYYLCKHTYGYGLPQQSISGPVKNLPAMQETQETWVQSLGCEDPLKKGMATPSSIPAWRIPWTEEPGGLQPVGSQSRTRRKLLSAHTDTHTRIYKS